MLTAADHAQGIDGLLEELLQRSGHDFRGYAPGSRQRRIDELMVAEGLLSVEELRARLDDPTLLDRVLCTLTVPVTGLFRDPAVFHALRARVVPQLATWPTIRVWVAGCATGEEAWSVAILLAEAGLLERSRIYATDLQQTLLDQALTGVYRPESVATWQAAYRSAGGEGEGLSTHCTVTALPIGPRLPCASRWRGHPRNRAITSLP